MYTSQEEWYVFLNTFVEQLGLTPLLCINQLCFSKLGWSDPVSSVTVTGDDIYSHDRNISSTVMALKICSDQVANCPVSAAALYPPIVFYQVSRHPIRRISDASNEAIGLPRLSAYLPAYLPVCLPVS